MTSKLARVRQEEKAVAKEYLKKAEDNYLQMLAAMVSGNYNAAGTLAIQCAISSADAICVHEKGMRSISQDHFDVCDLVGSVSLPDAREKAGILRRVIGKKNLIQYERRNMRQGETDEIARSVTRFYQWVKSNVLV